MTIAPSITAVAKNEALVLTIRESNSWDSNSCHFIQYDFILKNPSNHKVSGWSLKLPLKHGAALSQVWNATCTLDGTSLSIVPANYNVSIEAGQSVTFGMILSNAGTIDSDKAMVSVSYDNSTPLILAPNKTNNEVTMTPAISPFTTKTPDETPSLVMAKDVPNATTDDWLYVKDNQIVDKNGTKVWLTGVNWFGYNTGTNTFDCLWAADLNSSIASIADHGFNLLRVPISTELILAWKNGNYPTANYNHAINSYLEGLNSLEIFDYVIGQCHANGLKIMIDIHSTKSDPMGHMYPVWYNGDLTKKDYNDTLIWLAKRYKEDDTIIAIDLKNEPHGKENETPKAIWNDSTDDNNWKYVAQKTALNILKVNPNVLIMVEGIEIYPKDINTNHSFSSLLSSDYYYNWWGGNLRGVKDYPIDLAKFQNKLVYSLHDYGPAVYQQPWFTKGFTYNSLYNDCWYDNWFYLYKEKTAPLFIGEWGGYMTGDNLTWMTHLRTLIKTYHLHHTFWCFNANSGDTGGLVKDDFSTWDNEKYNFVKEVLWQSNQKFVGLDHAIPLGKNGISLSEYK